jgi:PIN domain nuclease of toxin-antitoxin system
MISKLGFKKQLSLYLYSISMYSLAHRGAASSQAHLHCSGFVLTQIESPSPNRLTLPAIVWADSWCAAIAGRLRLKKARVRLKRSDRCCMDTHEFVQLDFRFSFNKVKPYIYGTHSGDTSVA